MLESKNARPSPESPVKESSAGSYTVQLTRLSALLLLSNARKKLITITGDKLRSAIKDNPNPAGSMRSPARDLQDLNETGCSCERHCMNMDFRTGSNPSGCIETKIRMILDCRQRSGTSRGAFITQNELSARLHHNLRISSEMNLRVGWMSVRIFPFQRP
jgi:hypothetical protein